jgi:flagellar hook-length control protein FliK
MSLCAISPPFNTSHYELGVSQTSQHLVKYTAQILNHASETISLGWRKALNQQLMDMQSRNNKSGWDGYQANPISQQTMFAAMIFLTLLPDYIEMPDIVPEPTGEIGFLWEKGEDITLLISISPETIVFVELSGSSKSHGERKFPRELPSNIKKTLFDYFRIS